jgi:hypothetical protein
VHFLRKPMGGNLVTVSVINVDEAARLRTLSFTVLALLSGNLSVFCL